MYEIDTNVMPIKYKFIQYKILKENSRGTCVVCACSTNLHSLKTLNNGIIRSYTNKFNPSYYSMSHLTNAHSWSKLTFYSFIIKYVNVNWIMISQLHSG